MKKYNITTITVNPALDKSADFHDLIPEKKIRCGAPAYDAGGGGINVSKAIARLGGESLAVFTSGGSSGLLLEELIAKERIETKVIRVRNWTRENFIARDLESNQQYRFGFPGSRLSEDEQDAIFDQLKRSDSGYIVASGSLNEGLPATFYQNMAEIARNSGSKFIVDTSGEALIKVLETGVYLAKPNMGELAKLVGTDHLEADQAIDAAKQLIAKGSAEIIVVSMGEAGAILVSNNESYNIAAPKVSKKSTVGAGDSMVGGMVWALSQDKDLKEVLKWGVACGSAATMNAGTQLFNISDVRSLFKSI